MESSTRKVLVLMSTYNGEKYIKEQIDSILSQENVDVYLLIRDDGSIDNTVNILNSYDSKNIQIVEGENLGVVKSFFYLIDLCGDYFDYYSFADQDDRWDKDKLLFAIKYIDEFLERPALYSSNTRVVDSYLNLIKKENQNPVTTLGSALVKNYVTGCTTVINKNLLLKLKNKLDNLNVASHEWWINLVCLSLNGASVYDTNAHMDYRQHGRNVVGAPISFFSKWNSRFVKFRHVSYRRDYMAQQIIKRYGKEISSDKLIILKKASKFKDIRFNIILDSNFRTNRFIDNVCFWIILITRRI